MPWTWSSQLETGHPLIDSQHRHLFSLAGTFEAVRQVRHHRADSERVIMELIRYTTVHFAAEEELMRRNAYPLLADHVQLHQDLLGQVQAMVEAWREGRMESQEDLSAFLKRWVERHIADGDRQFITWLKASRPASCASPAPLPGDGSPAQGGRPSAATTRQMRRTRRPPG